MPVGRSIAIRSSLGGACLPSRATRSVMPAALCATVKRDTTVLRSSITQTACSRAAQSRPTKYVMWTPLLERPPTRGGLAGRSLFGAPRRVRRGATPCCRSRPPGLSEAAGLTVAVERLASKAVFGEAPEELFFTLGDSDRARNFLAATIGGCTSERASLRASGFRTGRAGVPRRGWPIDTGPVPGGADPVSPLHVHTPLLLVLGVLAPALVIGLHLLDLQRQDILMKRLGELP